MKVETSTKRYNKMTKAIAFAQMGLAMAMSGLQQANLYSSPDQETNIDRAYDRIEIIFDALDMILEDPSSSFALDAKRKLVTTLLQMANKKLNGN